MNPLGWYVVSFYCFSMTKHLKSSQQQRALCTRPLLSDVHSSLGNCIVSASHSIWRLHSYLKRSDDRLRLDKEAVWSRLTHAKVKQMSTEIGQRLARKCATIYNVNISLQWARYTCLIWTFYGIFFRRPILGAIEEMCGIVARHSAFIADRFLRIDFSARFERQSLLKIDRNQM